MMPSSGYLLCCIERTGSNLLAQALIGTGVAGWPREYFNPVGPRNPWIRDILGDSTLADGLPKILSAGTTPNGWFGAKVHWSHFQHLGMSINGEWEDWRRRLALREQRQARLPMLRSRAAAPEVLRRRAYELRTMATAYASLQSQIPDLRVIWLRRQNMVARAISHFRARRTGLWHRPVSESSAAPSNRVCNFNFTEIRILYCHGAFQEELWQQFFEQHAISPHCVIYEEFVADYESTVRGVLKFLDTHVEKMFIPRPATLKQSDDLSEEWEERYRKLSAEAGI